MQNTKRILLTIIGLIIITVTISFGQVGLSGNILDSQTIDSTFIIKDVSDMGKLRFVS